MTKGEIREIVDRLAELRRKQMVLEAEEQLLQAALQAQAERDLRDSKRKTAFYYGTGHAKALVTTVSSLKIQDEERLNSVLNNKILKQKVTNTISDPDKRTLISVIEGSYECMTPDEFYKHIPLVNEARATLQKKLRGKNFDKDRAYLEAVGMNEEDAAYYAYMRMEVENGRAFQVLAQVVRGNCEEDTLKFLREEIAKTSGVQQSYRVTLEVGENGA